MKKSSVTVTSHNLVVGVDFTFKVTLSRDRRQLGSKTLLAYSLA